MKEVTFDVTSVQAFYSLQPPDQQLSLSALVGKAIVMAVLSGALRYAQIARMTWEASKRGVNYWETDALGKDNKISVQRMWEQETAATDPVRVFDELYRRAQISQHRQRPCGPMFRDGNGVALSERRVREAAKSELQKAGINESRPNMIRSALITALHEEKINDFEVARYVQHSARSVVQHTSYQHNDRGKKCADKLTERFLVKGKDKEKK